MRVIVAAFFLMALAFVFPQTIWADDEKARVLTEENYFSNLDKVIQDSGIAVNLTTIDAHRLALHLADFHGIVQLDQSRWLALQEAGWTDGKWTPDYECTVVFVVDQSRAPPIRGWHDLLTSDVPIAISHYETSLGQSTILACALARGGDEGNLTPALTYFRTLHQAGRLYDTGERYDYQFDHAMLTKAPVAIMWDYQAAAIKKELGSNYVIVVPEEGSLKIEAGLSLSRYSNPSDRALKAYLQSERGREQLSLAGFCPAGSDLAYALKLPNPTSFYTITDHRQWITTSSNLKASWKRQVRLTHLYSLASRSEMMLFSLLMFFLLIFWSASMYMRISPGLVRRIFVAFAAFLLWLLILKLIKVLTVDDMEIFIWHLWYTALPAYAPLWCWMCYAFVYERMPPGPVLFALVAPALFFALAGLTNDLHQAMLILPADRINIGAQYSHGWIYWTMLVFQALYIVSGVALLLRFGYSRHKKRQATYVLLFATIILSFSLLYVKKVPFFFELDFVVVLILLFVVFMEILARDRLLGINYAIKPFLAEFKVPLAALNESGEWIYRNAAMMAFTAETPAALSASDIKGLLTLPANITGLNFPGVKLHSSRIFHPLITRIPGGYSLVLEDRSEVEAMFKVLAEKQEGLRQINRLLKRRHDMESFLAATREKAESMARLEAALSLKLRELYHCMTSIGNEDNLTNWLHKLQYARLLAGFCHSRLRISIMSLNSPTADFNYLCDIFKKTLKDLDNYNINSYLSIQGEGRLPSEIALILYEALFITLKLVVGLPGLSLYLGLRLDNSGINFFIRLPLLVEEIEQLNGSHSLSFGQYDLELLQKYNGKFEHLDDDDGSLIRLSFMIGGEETDETVSCHI